jgi:hypothetical protein
MFFRNFLNNRQNTKQITLLGSCFSNFTVNHHLIPLAKSKKIPLTVQTTALQQRSDILIDLINDLKPDPNLIKYYLSKKKDGDEKVLIQGKKVDYAKWYAKYLMQKIEAGKNVKDDTPDFIVMDSLCDIRLNLYKHTKENWKVLLGKMPFNDTKVTARFKEDFEFTGLLNPAETAYNVEEIFNYFYKKNQSLQLVYIYFPIDTQYLEQRWFDRGQQIKSAISNLKKNFPANKLIDIEIPPDLVTPIADPSHPSFSPEIWNHFYPKTYQYCSEIILKLAKQQNTQRQQDST